MKKLITLFIALLTVMGSLSLRGQNPPDTIKTLICSEIRRSEPSNQNHIYVELTNMGTQPVDLSQISLHNDNGWVYSWQKDENGHIQLKSMSHAGRSLPLAGTLQPGESYTVMSVEDGMHPDIYPMRPVQSLEMLEKADTVVHFLEWHTGGSRAYYGLVKPEWEMFGFDSVDVNKDFVDFRTGFALAVIQHFGDTATYLIDQVGLAVDWEVGYLPRSGGAADIPVAGVPQAVHDYTFVRKFSVKQGNDDWDVSRGTTEENSEWLLIPHNQSVGHNNMMFKTFDNHGDFHLDYSSDIYDFDEATKTLTVPWGTERYDSIMNGMTIGQGMAWYYTCNSVFEDSAYVTCRDGDILELYAVGNTLEKESWTIKVAPPAADMNHVFPKNNMRYGAIEDEEEFDGQYWATTGDGIITANYFITKGAELDSIKFVPYATRVDTLFKYVEWASNATAEIVTVDGADRVDLQNGDILKVTASGGSEKSYFIDVEDYEESKSDNTNLAAITWPDRPKYYMEGWGEDGLRDTIPGFSGGRASYQLMLPYGSTTVPALFAKTANLNAKMVIDPAVSLSGGAKERTTTITVTSESDTLEQVYTILFNVENPFKQKYVGEPVFSEFQMGLDWGAGAVEILNPTDEPIDLSQYMIVRDKKVNPADAITATWGWGKRFTKYVPGYKWTADPVEWDAQPGILEIDLEVNPLVEPGDVFVMAKLHPSTKPNNEIVAAQADIIFNPPDEQADGYFNPWGEKIDGPAAMWTVAMPNLNSAQGNYFLFKILNDSILTGEKDVHDPADFKLIDAWGDNVWPWEEINNGTNLLAGNGKAAWRKAGNYLPANPLGTGWSADSTSWWITGQHNDGTYNAGTNMLNDLGSANFGPVSIHQSIVSSLVYKVDAGFEGDLNIEGVSNSETVQQFFDNIIKADTGQVLEVLSLADASVKALTDPVVTNDTLVVTSANKVNVTKYVISTTPLDDDAVLTTVNSPSNITIEITGETGLIKGVAYGAILSEVMDSLKVPDLALAYAMDKHGAYLPMQMINYDSVKVDTRVGDSTFVKVVAQNGSSIKYKFSPEKSASDAFVISTMYTVDQDARTISVIPFGTATKSFWQYIEVVTGATASLVDKAGFERIDGLMNFDDKLVVVSEDGSTSVAYYLNFIDEVNLDVNQAPQVTMAFIDSTLAGNEVTLSAVAEDDGLPSGAMLTYLWEVIEGDATNVTIATPAALETDVTFAANGTYVLQLTVSDGELETAVDVSIIVNAVGISESHVPALMIYPNPARDRIFIELVNVQKGKSTLNIYDITGKSVYVKQLTEVRTMINLDLSSGLYIVRLTNANETLTKQLKILK